MGAINRVAQNFQVFFISMAIKPLVAAIITAIAIHMIIGRFQQEFVTMLTMLRHSIQLLR
jgi:flagellar biosynthetic protein FliR